MARERPRRHLARSVRATLSARSRDAASSYGVAGGGDRPRRRLTAGRSAVADRVSYFVAAAGVVPGSASRAARDAGRDDGRDADERASSSRRSCGDLSSIRAPRGSKLHARSWQTEAPLRMLLNNLDPEVAEHPESARRLWRLGPGRPVARRPPGDRAHAPASPRRRDAARPDRQAGGVFRTHPRSAARPDRELAPRPALGDLGRVPPPRGRGPDDVRADDRRVAGSTSAPRASCRARIRRSAAAGEMHFGSPDLAGRTILTAGLGGMGGAQPLAATLAGAAILCIEVDQRSIHRRLETRYLDEQAELARRRARPRASRRDPSGGRCPSACSGECGGRPSRRSSRAVSAFDLVTDQTAAHDPLTGYVPAEVALRGGGCAARAGPRRVPRARVRVDRARTSGQWSSSSDWGATFSIMATICEVRPIEAGLERRLHISGLRPGLYPAAVLSRGSDRSGGPRSRVTRPTSRAIDASCGSCSRTTRSSSAGSRWRRSGSRSRACRHGSAGSATETARRQVARSTTSSAPARLLRPS